jgi:hypothetical protein
MFHSSFIADVAIKGYRTHKRRNFNTAKARSFEERIVR